MVSDENVIMFLIEIVFELVNIIFKKSFRKVALLKLNNYGTNYRYFCGGVLIDRETVITGGKKLVFLIEDILTKN